MDRGEKPVRSTIWILSALILSAVIGSRIVLVSVVIISTLVLGPGAVLLLLFGDLAVFFVGLFGGLVGIWLGARYVTRKSVISQERVLRLTLLLVAIPFTIGLVLTLISSGYTQLVADSQALSDTPIYDFVISDIPIRIAKSASFWCVIGGFFYLLITKRGIHGVGFHPN